MAFKFLVIVCMLIGYCDAIKLRHLQPEKQMKDRLDGRLDERWMLFKRTHNKTYVNLTEEVVRRFIWEHNIQYIQDHNARYERGEITFALGENRFADKAEDELEDTYLSGLQVPKRKNWGYEKPLTQRDPRVPLAMDWREKKVVTPVKDQGDCGSCWAFASLGSLESLVLLKKNSSELVELSAQNLIDCTYMKFYNYACKNGWMQNSYDYIIKSGGIDDESCYPYKGKRQDCMFNSSCIGARISDYKEVPRSEYNLEKAIALVGPVAVTLDCNSKTFMFYKKGIYSNPSCSTDSPNHAMVVVGYSERYWVLKNSWGTDWGEHGYVYFERGVKSGCGIFEFATYPVL